MNRPSKIQFTFGEFLLDTQERILWKGGVRLNIDVTNLALLQLLVEHAGSLVKKDKIQEEIWPDSSVEEANINVRISQIRKLLGDNPREPVFIKTEPTLGYRFFHAVEPLYILEVEHESEINDSLPTHSQSSKPEHGNEKKIDNANKSNDNPGRVDPTPPLVTHTSRPKLIATFVLVLVFALSLLAAYFSYRWGAAESRAVVAENELQTRPRRDDSQQPSAEKKPDPSSNTVPIICPGDAPDYPVFNIDPLTFRDKGTQICSDFPLIDIALDTSNPQFSQSLAELNSVRRYMAGDQLVVMLYMHNGAANNLAPSQTTAQNVKLETTMSLSSSQNIASINGINVKGRSFYTVHALFSGDNVESKGGAVHVLLNDNEELELVENSGFVYDYEGKVILDLQNQNLGNSTFALGNLDAGWEYSLFFTYKLRVVQR